MVNVSNIFNLKSVLPYTWVLVAPLTSYAVYQLLSITSWFLQVVSGFIVSILIIAFYAETVVKLDREN